MLGIGFAALVGAVAGSAAVFLRLPGLILGATLLGLLVAICIRRRRLHEFGIATCAAGLAAATVLGVALLDSEGDSAVWVSAETLPAFVLAMVVAAIGLIVVMASLLARRTRVSD